MKNSISKSKVMKAAWTIFKKEGKRTMEAWSKALKRAWAWAKKTLAEPAGLSDYHVMRETAKAILVRATLVCYITDQSVASNQWIPKSVIQNGVIPQWLINRKEEEARSQHSYYGNGGSTLEMYWN